ncbi:ABC transporter ATP-binding protein [Paracoccus sp. MBLB3053]|uniref:ABC transporter ATP-binding protein n=1 Tax=Paracoccus aurantius TaxID=3073814 RepID=A0ABU2HY47_9RHOB|nr:ABC transporter ATP-binding protein [Paracoccus sp. MBLB3053]MDS9469652.1 ABC transporter ATP-binding protein [Paracoccus sp. MBLB3053]
MGGNYLLEARNLTMRFGGVVAVRDVSLSLREGELHCLIGPNGAGKSTFFRMLSGQHRPSSGEVLFNGRSIIGQGSARIARAGMGIKTQVPSVFNSMTVRENVMLAASRELSSVLAKKRCDEVMERIGIGHLAAAKVGILAHGQRQLVELATVIAPSPSLILLDEPAAGMTGDEVDRLGDLLIELARSCSVIVVEHDMAFIRRIARSITVFNQGSVLIEGPADQVLSDQRVRDVYLGKEVA